MKNKKSIKTRIHDKIIDIKEFVSDHKKSIAVAGVALTVGAAVIYKKGIKRGREGAVANFLELMSDVMPEGGSAKITVTDTGNVFKLTRF